MSTAIQRYHESFRDSVVRQVQWSEGRGLLLVTAMYCGVIGSATFTLGLVLGVPTALIVGWLLGVVGKGTFHLIFLGKPARAWRALRRPHSSWLSRGVWALTLFSLVGGAYTLPFVTGSSDVVERTPLYWIALVLVLFLLAYDGFLIRAALGVRMWSNWMMPVMFPIFGLMAGGGILTLIDAFDPLPSATEARLEHLIAVFLVSGAVVLTVTLWLAARQPGARSSSTAQLTKGFLRGWFWIGVILLTIVLPAATAVASAVAGLPIEILGIVAGLSVVGEFAFKYTVLACGTYAPMCPPWFAEHVAARARASRIG